MHKRTKACMIPKAVKERVWDRDGHKCVGCGRYAPMDWACAHYIPRSHGGRGDIPQNILTLCPECHRAFDEGPDRENLKEKYLDYLEGVYGPLNMRDLVYRKW